MRFLTERQRRTLKAICDTIKPGECGRDDAPRASSVGTSSSGCCRVASPDPRPNELSSANDCARRHDELSGRNENNSQDVKDPFSHSAAELGIADLVEKALYERDDDQARQRLGLLLNLLDRRFFNGVMSGNWRRFENMTLDQRTGTLQGMANSRVNALRGAFHDVKQMATFVAYAHFPPLGDNPTWSHFGYAGQASNPRRSFEHLPTVIVDELTEMDCEVLVVGSGAGGGVVAAELAAAGHDVLIVEKGKQFGNHDMPQTELAGMRELYEGKGVCKTIDRSMIVLAGSTLGGGTTVNWMTCLEPPQKLREQWASEFGFRAALSPEYSHAIRAVSDRIGVTTDESPANAQNAILERGCRKLGYGVSVIPRNVRGCVECDFCGFGCRYGAKQDTRRTFLYDAVGSGARMCRACDGEQDHP